MSFFTIENLLEYADELKLSPETIRLALFELDSESLQNLIDACLKYPDPYLYDHFVFHITVTAEAFNSEASFAAMRLLLEHSNKEFAHPAALWTLSKLRPIENVLVLLREALNDPYKGTYQAAAEFIVKLQYHEDTLSAIEDENSHVRLFALEEADVAHNIATILKALTHEDPALRKLSAWASGRKKIHQAFELLLQQCQQETDLETLRAMIWALGVLRHWYAKPVLETFLKHQETSIVQTAQEALGKLV